jgi:alkanesulfonate monooxygenase SsuD/methylene tetrahydromethanopterin reductase-like flavin-dependent oxidoreductase (luciferase family)
MPSYGCLLPTRGVVFSSDDRTELTARVEADVVGVAERAEALGYESVWIGDSVLAKPRLEPLSTLAAIAAATDGINLGTAVYLPNLRHPVNVAHQTATVDQLSGGRLSIGVGVGVRPPERREMEELGVDYSRRGAILDEGLEVITSLWSGEEVSYDGEFYSLDEASIGFQPAVDPKIYVASAAFNPEKGFPRSIRNRIRTHGSGWLPIAMDPDVYGAGLENVRSFMADTDRGADAIDPGYYIDVVVDDSEEAALDEARAFLKGYYTEEQLSYADDETFSDEKVQERGVFGTPEQVAQHIGEFVDAGAERFVVRFTAANQREQLHRFQDVVDLV